MSHSDLCHFIMATPVHEHAHIRLCSINTSVLVPGTLQPATQQSFGGTGWCKATVWHLRRDWNNLLGSAATLIWLDGHSSYFVAGARLSTLQ